LPYEELFSCAKDAKISLLYVKKTLFQNCASGDYTLLCQTESQHMDALKVLGKFSID